MKFNVVKCEIGLNVCQKSKIRNYLSQKKIVKWICAVEDYQILLPYFSIKQKQVNTKETY